MGAITGAPGGVDLHEETGIPLSRPQPDPTPPAGPSPHDLDDLMGRLFRYALAVCHDHARAEDAVQETLVRACARPGSSWDTPYLMKSVRHRVLDLVRSDTRREKREQRAQEMRAAQSPGPSIRDEYDVDLNAALATLRPDEREVLYLSLVDGQSASAIGELMEKPRGSVLSLRHRARQKLREALGSNVDPPVMIGRSTNG